MMTPKEVLAKLQEAEKLLANISFEDPELRDAWFMLRPAFESIGETICQVEGVIEEQTGTSEGV